MAKVPQGDSSVARRSADPRVAAAIDLGWRVAALHALNPSTLVPVNAGCDDLLVNRHGLAASDRLELELSAIAGVANRVDVPLTDGDLQALLDLIPAATTSASGEEGFRRTLAQTHIALAKRLWANDEGHGRAYELGNFLSDTWNRMLRPSVTQHPQTELSEIFGAARVQRVKVLIDNLQSRLDPAAVHIVDQHLNAWRDRVADHAPADPDYAAASPTRAEIATSYEPIERQTIIWRQILSGDKEPEAYIDHARRSEVRDELTRQLWRRYRRYWWLLPIAAVLGFAIGYLLAHEKSAATGLIGTVTAVAAMLGITRAAMVATVRRALQDWGELMWNRALAAVICRETLCIDELLPPARARRRAPPARRSTAGRA